jgi:hypothetical protein
LGKNSKKGVSVEMDQRKNHVGFFFLSKKFSYPEDKKWNIPDSSKLCSESFNFCIERFSRSIRGPVVKVINNGLVIILHSFYYALKEL